MKRPQLRENTSADDLLISLAETGEDFLDQLEEYDGAVDFDNEQGTAYTMYELAMEALYGPEIWDYIDELIRTRHAEYTKVHK